MSPHLNPPVVDDLTRARILFGVARQRLTECEGHLADSMSLLARLKTPETRKLVRITVRADIKRLRAARAEYQEAWLRFVAMANVQDARGAQVAA